MAAVVRQPFAPLDGTRLQNLTNLKNRQNSISNAPVKRKAAEVEVDDSENVDPSFFSKRSKGAGADKDFAKDFFKPSNFILTKAVSTPSLPSARDILSPPSKLASARPRSVLQPKSPAARLNTSISVSSLTAPAGRSPTRGSKRIGILSRRRTQRVDPPSFGLGAAAPFSLDAALKGTIPSYSGSVRSSASSNSLQQPEVKSSWFFDIHEDTPEQEMTNLLQHGTCTLDISSDEESERKARRDCDEGRDKENIAPADDVSQTSARARAAPGFDDMIVEKQRGPLIEMDVSDFYAQGCDDASVIIVPGDDDEAETVIDETEQAPLPESIAEDEFPQPDENFDDLFEFAPLEVLAEPEASSVDLLMGKDEPAAKAALLEPIEGTGESFELWESGSARDDGDVPASPIPAAMEDVAEASTSAES
ncbi:hypothetical protein B0T25DRAFT_129307 [Lasiosphaeria hispida]|uniref:Thymidylate kinase n=1 Tax=Lasiosphaeria hispida TaxID=260671 RepID=A0AAJ0MIL1_9PEZI|nr:hypothetical protein B0T25DRAFT_129307 [Lasiosphaeria hispida]